MCPNTTVLYGTGVAVGIAESILGWVDCRYIGSGLVVMEQQHQDQSCLLEFVVTPPYHGRAGHLSIYSPCYLGPNVTQHHVAQKLIIIITTRILHQAHRLYNAATLQILHQAHRLYNCC